MKKAALSLCLLLLCLGLAGCELTQQPEHQAYVVSLGIDTAPNGHLDLWVQVPTIGSGGSGSGSSGGGSNYELFSARGESIPVALDLMMASVPTRLQLSLTKSIIVSEELARSEEFHVVVDELIMTYHIYGNAGVIVTRGTAKEFLENQIPAIGIRLSTSVTAGMEQYHGTGYIPINTLYGLFCANHSIYSDPVLTLAATGPDDKAKDQGGGNGGGGGGTEDEPPEHDSPPEGPAPMSDEDVALPGTLPRTGPNKNQFMGCALIRDCRMVGLLDGEDSRWLSVLRNEVSAINYESQGKSIQLLVAKTPQVDLDLKPDGMSVSVHLVMASYALLDQPDLGALQDHIAGAILELFAHCQQAGVEPFDLAELAAINFATAQDFADYRFRDKFCQAPVAVSVSISPKEI